MGSLYENKELLLRELENARCILTERELCKRLEWSRATFYRALDVLREDNQIELRRGEGYRLTADVEPFHGFLPQELESLAVFWQMFENVQKPLSEPYEALKTAFLRHLRARGVPFETWQNRIHYLLPHQRKQVTPATFRKISEAILHQKVISFQFSKKDSARPEKREVHPQQLIFYRNGWSLDALDESRIGASGPEDKGLRQFPLDLISQVRTVRKPWQEVSTLELQQFFASGYGLYAGKADALAKIQFTGIAASYVEREQWHPHETKEILPGGTLRLTIPYVSKHPEELIGDILRWGENAVVEGPPELKKQVREKIKASAKNYNDNHEK